MIIHYEYRERHLCGGEAINPEERWSDRTDSHYDWELKGISVSKPEGTFDREEIPVIAFVDGEWTEVDCEVGDELYCVTVQYGSGDTFGRSYGHGTVACVCIDAESARRAVKLIEDGETSESFAYASWRGYFESLEYVDFTREVLRD